MFSLLQSHATPMPPTPAQLYQISRQNELAERLANERLAMEGRLAAERVERDRVERERLEGVWRQHREQALLYRSTISRPILYWSPSPDYGHDPTLDGSSGKGPDDVQAHAMVVDHGGNDAGTKPDQLAE